MHTHPYHQEGNSKQKDRKRSLHFGKMASGQKHTLGELGFEPCKCVHQQMICTTDAKQVTHEFNQEPV